MSKPERPRRGMLLVASSVIAVVSYIVCTAAAACGGDHPEAVAPSDPMDAQAINDDTYAIGDASGGNNPFGPTASGTPTTSASGIKAPTPDPTTSTPKTTPKPRTTGTPSAPPKTDSPPPGRHKPF